MDDKQLDKLLDDAARTYRVPPAAPFDAMWAQVEREAFSAPPRRSAPGWRTFAAGIAASLLIGVVAGRLTMRAETAAPLASAVKQSVITPIANNAPYHQATEELLGRTALLLAAFPAESKRGGSHEQMSAQATQLLTTTRLLLDSPVGKDARMKQLLEDLELVLAQVSRLPAPQNKTELTLISQQLEERDLVPRIRSAVVDMSGNEP